MDVNQRIKKILQAVHHTRDEECDCSYVYELMDEIAEALSDGVDLSVSMPEIHHHLDHCGCCNTEIEALRKILEVDTQV